MVPAARRADAHGELRFRLRKGLDLPLAGTPAQTVTDARAAARVAVAGADLPGRHPKVLVEEGERVRAGQPLVADRRDPRVALPAPGGGTVTAILRGERRSVRAVVVSLDEADGESFAVPVPSGRTAEAVTGALLASGLWTALRTRPFGRIPEPGTKPAALFVTAIDTNPGAPDPAVVLAGEEAAFRAGLDVLASLTEGPVYLCTAPGSAVPDGNPERITRATFAGPHPAGLAGTHIHFLCPAGLARTVWHVNYADAAAIGTLFTTGRVPLARTVALAGPAVRSPRLVRTRLGADLAELTAGEVADGAVRIVSGSVLSGRRAVPPAAFLGRTHLQVSVLHEPALQAPGPAFSASGWKRWLSRAPVAFTTARHGARTALFPNGAYERVMPLDILPTLLLRALLIGDEERAMDLGCLELDEEDVALCTFVCAANQLHGPSLRTMLDRIEASL